MAPAILADYTGQKEVDKYSHNLLGHSQSDSMMGKSGMISKGHSSGFVSDYRQRVGSVEEDISEGLCSSGKFDTEMTVSEESMGAKRKCISLNVDSSERFYGVPLEVLSVSKMSSFARKELEGRLRVELDQVRRLRDKIELRYTSTPNSAHVSYFSDGGQRKSVSISGNGGNRLKHSQSARFEPKKQNQVTLNASDHGKLLKQCETLLKRLMAHKSAHVFNEPVDIVKLNIPDYFSIIKHPMDLGTVLTKMKTGAYSSPLGFAEDVRLIFDNAVTYNPIGHVVNGMAKQLRQYFETRWKPIQKKLQTSGPTESGVYREVGVARTNSLSKKRKFPSSNSEVKPNHVNHIMTAEERTKLSKDLESLIIELPPHINDFLRRHCANESQTTGGGEEEIEIDMEALSDDTLFTLRTLIDDFLQEKQLEAERRGMEILNQSTPSNPSLQPSKEDGPTDVDMGNSEINPLSNYPAVEIKKDAAPVNISNASSNSEIEFGVSSHGELDLAKAPSSGNLVKDEVSSGLNGQTVDLADEHNWNETDSGSDLLEQGSQPKPASDKADSQQEWECGPPERQVSPDKLYRQALLKNRFADTILKAREKALDKGEKGDPEKLRRKKEALERQQREEKARLQAEAKAAEDARRKAEAEVAAEVKRQKEIEREAAREAARQALQKMEKTVEINENFHYLQDFEKLNAAPVPHMPVMDESSSDHAHDILGSFNLGGGNPLEQLGLYMRTDDDEEEEIDHSSVPKPTEETITDNEITTDPLENEMSMFNFNDGDNTLEKFGLTMKMDEEEDEDEEGDVQKDNKLKSIDDVEEGEID